MREKIRLCTTVATVAVLMGAPSVVWAQDVDGEPATATESEAGEQPATSGTIIVTARRREEALTDVPLSITAFNEEALEAKGIERVDDLQLATPSLRLVPTAARRTNSQYEIRGIGAVESLVTQDPAVGIYVNEMYLARATGTNQSFYDISNVQVLYGPQGTLFGRNTPAGAVLINTNLPTNKFEGSIKAGYGNFDRRELTGVVNVPVSDQFAVRFAGQRVKRDGYFTNLSAPANAEKLGAIDTWAGRATAQFTTDRFQNTTVFSYFESDEPSTPVVLFGVRAASITSASRRSRTVDALTAQQQLGFYQANHDAFLRDYSGGDPTDLINGFTNSPSGYERAVTKTVTNTSTLEITNDILLKNIFGYHDVNFQASTDFDGSPLKLVDTWYDQSDSQISNELQLQGSGERFNWVVGALYFREEGRDIQNSVQAEALVTHQDLQAVNESYALFAQGTFEILDGLSLTAGGRYSWDNRQAVYDNPTSVLLAGPTAGVVNCSIAAISPNCYVQLTGSFQEPTYNVSLDYKISPDILIYAAHRHGYRAGGFNARVPTSALSLEPFTPETIDDIEIGFKGSYDFGGGASAFTNLALYRADYNDLQQSAARIDPGSGLATTAIFNAADATIKGLEFEAGITPVPWLSISGYLGLVDAQFDTFEVNPTTTLNDVPFPISDTTGGVTAVLTPVDSFELGTVSFTAAYSFRSEFYGDNGLPTDAQPPEALVPSQKNVNLSLEWKNIMGGPISGQLWARNLTNELRILDSSALANTSLGIGTAIIGEPRTYGITLTFEFGR